MVNQKTILSVLLLLSVCLATETTFDDAATISSTKSSKIKEKGAWLQNFITPQKKTNTEMYTKHWVSQERVRKEIQLACGISNTSKFDYNLMIKLIDFKLHYGNHATKEEVEAREVKATVKDIECVDTISRIQVPEDSAIIEASDAL